MIMSGVRILSGTLDDVGPLHQLLNQVRQNVSLSLQVTEQVAVCRPFSVLILSLGPGD